MYETSKVFTVSKLCTFFFFLIVRKFNLYPRRYLYIIPNDDRHDEKSIQIQWYAQ